MRVHCPGYKKVCVSSWYISMNLETYIVLKPNSKFYIQNNQMLLCLRLGVLKTAPTPTGFYLQGLEPMLNLSQPPYFFY